MKKNNILFTRYAYCQQGGLFDQQIMKKGKGQVPLKSDGSPIGNIEKYGGYNKATVSYFMYVSAKDKKGQPVYLFVPVLLYLASRLKTDADREAYCLEEWQREGVVYTDPQVLLKEIRYNALLEINGYRMQITSRSGKQIIMKNAVELCVYSEQEILIKRISKFLGRQQVEKGCKVTVFDGIDEGNTLALYDAFVQKVKNSVYKEKMSAQEKTLAAKRDNFICLSVEDKCKVLSEILHLFQCNPVLSDLTLIGGAGQAGRISLSFDVTKQKGLTFISQSTTGFFEQRIPLVPFERP